MTTTLPAHLADGTYVVAWRAVSADSHPVSGAFTFSIGAPTPGVDASVLSAAAGGTDRVVAALFAIARLAAFIGLALLLGAAALACWSWRGQPPARVRRAAWAGWGVLAAATVAVVLLQGPYAAGLGASQALSWDLLHTTLQSHLGRAASVRLILLGAAAGLLALGAVRHLGARTAGWLALGVALAATWSVAGHPSAGMQVMLATPLDAVHLVAGSVWIGGLLILAVHVHRSSESVEHAVRRFSPLAATCVGALVVTGSYALWRQVGTLPALTGTTYGRLLMVKLGAVVGLVGLGYLARRLLRRPSGPFPELGRSIAVEAVIGIVILAVTAVLVGSAPARTTYSAPVHTSHALELVDSAGAHTTGTLQVDVEPARRGRNAVHLYVLSAGGQPLAVEEVSASLALPSQSLGPFDVALQRAGPGHYLSYDAQFPLTGRWTLTVSVRTTDIDTTSVDLPVTIR